MVLISSCSCLCPVHWSVKSKMKTSPACILVQPAWYNSMPNSNSTFHNIIAIHTICKNWNMFMNLSMSYHLIFFTQCGRDKTAAILLMTFWNASSDMKTFQSQWKCDRWQAITCNIDGIVYCRIWSWSPVLCEKHGPRDSVDKNRGRRPRFLSLLRPEGHVFHTARETMIKSYYSTLADWFFSCFMHINMNFSALKWALLAQFMVARGSALLLWTCCQRTQMNNCHENLNTCVNELNGI